MAGEKRREGDMRHQVGITLRTVIGEWRTGVKRVPSDNFALSMAISSIGDVVMGRLKVGQLGQSTEAKNTGMVESG